MPAQACGAPEPEDGQMRMGEHTDDVLVTLLIAEAEFLGAHSM